MIDTHVHFWSPKRLSYPWLEGCSELNRTFYPTDLCRATEGLPLDGWVFIQAECRFEDGWAELEWVLSLAEHDRRFLGIVPWAPVHEGAGVNGYLRRLVQASPLVKGVRRLIQSEADPDFCLQPDFVEGVRALGRHGLSMDLCISHTQLTPTIQLVQRCPNVLFILDHIAKPDIRSQQTDPWRSEIRELACQPNTVCKLSGMVTEADHARWKKEDLKPYIDHVLDAFGSDRVMFGSDWPVMTLASSYTEWLDALKWAFDGLDGEDKNKLFHQNAVKFYRLEVDDHRRDIPFPPQNSEVIE